MLLEFRQNMADLNKLRKDYIEAGGTDPDFLINLDNLQEFYSQSKPTLNSLFNKDQINETNKSFSKKYDSNVFYYNRCKFVNKV